MPAPKGRGGEFLPIYGAPGRPAGDAYQPNAPLRREHFVNVADRNGNIVETWTQWDKHWEGSRGPHHITINPYDPEKHVWIIDDDLQQVFKFSHDGNLLLTVGEKGVAGEDTGHFNLPSGVAIVKDGSFYVSDGYRNSRIVKFSPEGKYLLEWGKKGNADGELNLPHCVAVDYSLKVYVADRENKRIQIFDANGKFLRKIAGPPFITPQSIAVARDGTIYVTESGNEAPPDETGVLVLRPDGSFIERVGRYGNYDGQVQDPHWVAVGKNGELYVADFAGKRVQKFVRGK